MITRSFDSLNSYVSITPDDFRTMGQLTHQKAWAIFVGTGGNLTLKGSDGVIATFMNVPNGTLLPVHAVEIMATGTTASNLVALYSIQRT